jgi:hypothetical protein
MSLRDSLTRIYVERGQLTPQAVVDEARPPDSELHNRFEWDDEVAGEKYRLVQARELIRSVTIEYAPPSADGAAKRVRAFSTVRKQDPERVGYQPTEELLEDDFSRKLLLKQCERDIAELQQRYGHLAEFADLIRRATA